MRTLAYAALVVFVAVPLMTPTRASSHREAPLISQDPLADNTDVYAFVSPERPDRVVLISNFIPLQFPSSGPNFWKFDDNVLYEILIDNTGDAVEDLTFQFRFRTEIRNPNTFLYNTGPISSLDDPDLNVRQFYTVTRVAGPRRTGAQRVIAANVPALPANVGVSSIRDYNGQLGTGVFAAGVRGCPRVRRPAGRRVLRRPGRDLRPAAAPYARERPGLAHRQPGRLQRPHDRDRAADHVGHAERRPADRRQRSERDDWRLVDRQPHDHDDAERRRTNADGRLGPGVASWQPARERGRHSRWNEGRLQLAGADRAMPRHCAS